MKIQLKRSNVLTSGAAKTPTASQLEYGELAVNYNNSDPAIFLKDSNNNVIRISGVGNISDDGLTNVPDGTTPPSNPEVGNLWYNSDQGRLYIYFQDADSSQWVDASPDSWDPSSYPDVTNTSAQSNTLDDRYAMLNGGNGLKIDSSGNVGIGTTSVSSPGSYAKSIQISDANSSSIVLSRTDSTAHSLEIGVFNDGSLIESTGAASLRFKTNSSERLRIDSSGNVGIGTSSFPANGTNLKTADSTIARHILEKTGSNARTFEIGNGGTFLNIYDATADSERLRIDSSGNVGIGTTNIQKPLHVRKDGESYPLLVQNRTNSVSTAGIAFIASGSDIADGQYASIEALSGGTGNTLHNLLFRTCISGGTPTERMRINSSGNVGIGNTNPTSSLEVHSAGGSNIIAKSTNGNGGYLNYTGLASNGTTTFSVNHNGSGFFAGTTGIGGTSAAPNIELNANGSATFGINTSTYQEGVNITHGSSLSALTVYSANSSSHRSLVVFDNGQTGTAKYRASIYANGSAEFAGGVEVNDLEAGYYTATPSLAGGAGNNESGWKNWHGKGYDGRSTSVINADGSASFDGHVYSGIYAANNNFVASRTGQIEIGKNTTDDNSSVFVFTRYNAGTTSEPIKFTAAGRAEFAETVKAKGLSVIAPGTTDSTQKLWTGKNALGNVQTSNIYADGSASFAGNVGINTTSASTKLDVVGSTTNGSGTVNTLRLKNGGTSSNDGAKLLFTSGTSTDGAGIAGQGVTLNSANLLFYAGGNNERMRIDSSGNVLIGGALPSAPNITLNNSGSASFAGSIQSGGNPDDGGANGFKVSNGKLTTTRASTADSILCYSQGTSTPTVTIKANGSATFAGSVSIGGTANANTIDEYEEGTWTPAWNFAGGGSIPVIVNEAKYTKIGDTVTLICNITNGSGASSPTGDVTITGLPYSCSGQSAGSIALMRNWNTNFDGNLSVAATGNTLSFRKNASNVTDANLNATDFNLTQFSCVIYITVTYRVS